MDLGSIFLILAVLVFVGVFISRPFFLRQPASGKIPNNQNKDREHLRSTLLAEQDQVLNALQELDFDHALGKIPEEEYPEQRATLLQAGAAILRQLDSFHEQTPAQAAEARMEAAVAARRADAALRANPARSAASAPAGGTSQPAALIAAPEEDELEKIIAARRQARQEKATGFCPRCGKPVQKSDRFCPKCGATLASQVQD